MEIFLLSIIFFLLLFILALLIILSLNVLKVITTLDAVLSALVKPKRQKFSGLTDLPANISYSDMIQLEQIDDN